MEAYKLLLKKRIISRIFFRKTDFNTDAPNFIPQPHAYLKFPREVDTSTWLKLLINHINQILCNFLKSWGCQDHITFQNKCFQVEFQPSEELQWKTKTKYHKITKEKTHKNKQKTRRVNSFQGGISKSLLRALSSVTEICRYPTELKQSKRRKKKNPTFQSLYDVLLLC